jgi:hypothetical protein
MHPDATAASRRRASHGPGLGNPAPRPSRATTPRQRTPTGPAALHPHAADPGNGTAAERTG